MTVIVVMGVSGSGKTTIGTALAAALDVEYAEADTFHPKANIDKMTAGTPLTDADRAPWLEAIAGWIREHEATGGVVTSSALKRRYRDVLRSGGDVWFAHLDGPRELLAERMQTRSGHFMPVSLLDSQLATLEPLQPDEPGAIFAITGTPAEITEAALTAFREHA
ncbi:gluconokinase [Amycolatopsis sp. NPDC026612]|uniref:gluconokinase n=1 Tax=Amycolatopsis sp. NPDC026612 TaxID=3155466 RepID=UPI0034109718